MTMICRVLPHEAGDGPGNMALDEALLDSVAADPSAAVARTYSWSSPTLSLGYFQAVAEVEADPRWRGVPVVRRPTGGGALWHDKEMTYAVVIPASHPASRPSSALYRAIHAALAGRLRGFGIDAGLRGGDGPARESDARPFLCFTDRSPEDIVLRGGKVVGGAQRRRSGAVLQHGSLMLARSPTTPELPGLSDLAPLPDGPVDWAETLQAALLDALGLPARADAVRPDERARAGALRLAVYDDPAWTRRR